MTEPVDKLPDAVAEPIKTADAGVDEKTPWIILGGVHIVLAVVVGAVILVATLVWWFTAR